MEFCGFGVSEFFNSIGHKQPFTAILPERLLPGAISNGQRNTLSENHCLAKMLLNQRNS